MGNSSGDEIGCFMKSVSLHMYEIRPRKDKRGVDLISDVLPFGRLWYRGPDAISSLRRLDPARQNGDDVFH
jgi:hypothetical protein